MTTCITTALLTHFKRSVIHIDLETGIVPGIRVEKPGGVTEGIINKLSSWFVANTVSNIYWSFESDKGKEEPVCSLNFQGNFSSPILIKLHQDTKFAKLIFLVDNDINGKDLIIVLRKIVNDRAASDHASLSDRM